MRALSIPRQILDEMIAHARALDPHECCGMLGGKDGKVTHHYKIKNVVALAEAEKNFEGTKLEHLQNLSPEERAEIAFIMDSSDMSFAIKDMRAKNIELHVIYHSHPRDPARPSLTDIKKANEFESYRKVLNLPEPVHLIISLKIPWWRMWLIGPLRPILKLLKINCSPDTTPVANAFRIVDETVTQVPYQTT